MLVYSLKKKLRKDRKETNTSGVTSERMWEMGGGRNRVAAGLFTMYLKESSVKMTQRKKQNMAMLCSTDTVKPSPFPVKK